MYIARPLNVRCKFCNSARGEPCRTLKSGSLAKYPHGLRRFDSNRRRARRELLDAQRALRRGEG